jgi:beta-lactamase class A
MDVRSPDAGFRPRRTGALVLAACAMIASGCRPPSPSASPSPGATGAPANVRDASEAGVEAVRGRLLSRIARTPGAVVGIAVHDLASGRRVSIAGDSVFHAASTMKVPVLFALYGEFEAGRIPRDAMLRLTNTFHSIVDGSPYTLSPADDSDSTLSRRSDATSRCDSSPSG